MEGQTLFEDTKKIWPGWKVEMSMLFAHSRRDCREGIHCELHQYARPFNNSSMYKILRHDITGNIGRNKVHTSNNTVKFRFER